MCKSSTIGIIISNINNNICCMHQLLFCVCKTIVMIFVSLCHISGRLNTFRAVIFVVVVAAVHSYGFIFFFISFMNDMNTREYIRFINGVGFGWMAGQEGGSLARLCSCSAKHSTKKECSVHFALHCVCVCVAVLCVCVFRMEALRTRSI